MKILSNTIRPASIFFKPDDGTQGGGAGGGVEGADAGGRELGGSFTKLMEDLKGPKEGAAADPPKTLPPKDEAKKAAPPAKGEKKELPKGADIPAAALVDPAKPKDAGHDNPAAAIDPNAAPTDDAKLLAEETKGMSPAAQTNWKTLRAKYETRAKTAEDRAVAAEKQLQELQAKLPAPEKLQRWERLEKEHGELSSTVETIALERSRPFQEKFVQGRRALIDAAAERVVAAGGDAAAFREALKLTGKARYEAIEESFGTMPGFQQNQIGAKITALEELDAERDKTLADARGNLEKWDSEEREKQMLTMRETQKHQKEAFGAIRTELAKDFILLREVPDEQPGGKEFNQARAELIQRAENFLFNATSFNDFATAAIAAEQAPILQEMLKREIALRQALEAQLAEIHNADPGGLAKNGSGGAPKKDDGAEGGGFAGRFADALSRQE